MENKSIGDRTAFLDITKNPDVASFLDQCQYIHEPSPNEIEKIKELFTPIEYSSESFSENIVAIDANGYEAKIRDDIPFTNLGIVKVSNFLLKRNSISKLTNNKFLNPFEVAKMQSENQSYLFVFPNSNMKYKEEKSVRDSFRLKSNELFQSFKNFENDDNSSLMSTLFWLSNNRKNSKDLKIILPRCPNEHCEGKNIEIINTKEEQCCPYCNLPIYPTDSLRIWEEINEDAVSNKSALTRFSNVIKHILLANYLKLLKEKNPENYLQLLNNTIFVINGPLAVFGNPAWVHGSLMKIIDELNNELKNKGFNRMMIIGIIDHSDVLTYANFLSKHLENKSIMCVSDDFRNKYINYSGIESSTTFGNETYYGQDFIYKSSKGKIKVFNIPYPFKNKDNINSFKIEKSNINLYKDLKRYIAFIEEFDCDMFDNSVIPAVLAKKYSIINLQPGSKILDLFAKNNIK